ncbi:MAG: hypothetical protein K6L75_14655 [Cellvibrionaceae bacterium]
MKIQCYLIGLVLVSFYSSSTYSEVDNVFKKSDSQQKIIYINDYDANNDLAVSEKERDVIENMMFSFIDKNKNLKIEGDEYFKFQGARLEDKLFLESSSHVKQSIIRFDSLDDDGDKKITFSEFSKSSLRIFNIFDKNKDSVLDKKDKYFKEKEYVPIEDKASIDDRSDEALNIIKQKISSAKYLLSMPSTHNWNGVFSQYDKNKTGTITKSVFDSQRKNVFDRVDINSDGWLSEDEYIGEYRARVENRLQQARGYFFGQIKKDFLNKDASKNGSLSIEEYLQGSKEKFNRFDVDNDGFVSLGDDLTQHKSITKY